jgi:hypothetical protein
MNRRGRQDDAGEYFEVRFLRDNKIGHVSFRIIDTQREVTRGGKFPHEIVLPLRERQGGWRSIDQEKVPPIEGGIMGRRNLPIALTPLYVTSASFKDGEVG